MKKKRKYKKSSKASTLELIGTGASIVSAIVALLQYLGIKP